MAIFRILIALTILAIVSHKTSATDYIVGDDNGWKLNFNYTAWAQDKQFWVGDKLIFNYAVGVHNVVKVDGVGFKQCLAPDTAEAMKSGKDVITLATPGRKWYICSVGKHCEVGQMKLFVNVLSQVGSPAPAPGPVANSADGITISKLYSSMVGVFGVVVMMIMMD